MDNVTRESIIRDLVQANEDVLKKHGLKNVRWASRYFLDGDEEVMASNVCGPIGERSRSE